MPIKLENVSFKYDNGFKALENINFTLDDGESIAIIGQNGAGKTTMVKLISGLLKPTSGTVYINDMDTKDYTTAKIARSVGYVFQNPDDQIFHNTVLEEIKFGPKILKFDKPKFDEIVNMATEISGLKEFIDENPYNLPLSIRKFVTIASVIAMDTNVIIFDEPTAGQDFYGINILKNILKTLKKMGKTIITITHDMEFIANNFDNVVVMANKQILKISNPNDIFYDESILEKSNLKRPIISEITFRLGIKSNIIKMNEFINTIKDKIKVK